MDLHRSSIDPFILYLDDCPALDVVLLNNLLGEIPQMQEYRLI